MMGIIIHEGTVEELQQAFSTPPGYVFLGFQCSLRRAELGWKSQMACIWETPGGRTASTPVPSFGLSVRYSGQDGTFSALLEDWGETLVEFAEAIRQHGC